MVQGVVEGGSSGSTAPKSSMLPPHMMVSVPCSARAGLTETGASTTITPVDLASRSHPDASS